MSILMLPVDWVFHVSWLRTQYGIGRDKAYDLVKEAIEHGYCRRVQVRDKGGRAVRFEYHFSDDPADLVASQTPFPEKPEAARPLPEKSDPARATSGKAGRIQKKDLDKRLNSTNTPLPTPQQQRRRRRRGARERDYSSHRDEWVSVLRAEERNRHVVDCLIVPLLSLSVKHEDPLLLLRQVRDHPVLVEHPDHVLRQIAERVVKKRKVVIAPKCVLDEIPEALKSCSQLLIGPQAPSWTAWVEHWRARGEEATAEFYERQGHMTVYTEWPRGHPRYSPEAPAGRAA